MFRSMSWCAPFRALRRCRITATSTPFALVLSALVLSETVLTVPAPPAWADDELTDRLAISFSSQYAFQFCEFAAPFNPVTMYVMLAGPTFGELHGWEAAIRLNDGEAPLLVSATVGLGGQNTGTWPEFAVTFPEPVATSDLMVLATVTMLPVNWAECLVLTGLRSPSLPDLRPLVWPAADAPIPITRSAIWPNGVAAATNGCAPIPEGEDFCAGVVAGEHVSWGSVKASYR